MLGEYGKYLPFFIQNFMARLLMRLKKAWDLTVVLELFLEIYSAFTQEEIPAEKQVKEFSFPT